MDDREKHPRASLDTLARLDLGRRQRAGVPEVVFAQGKRFEQVVAISAELAQECGRAVVSRLPEGWAERLHQELAGRLGIEVGAAGAVAVVFRPETERVRRGGVVGVLAAGTADIGVAEEARIMALEMGCDVLSFYDVGVAGIHRLVDPLERLLAAGVSAVVAVAGMDGALPTVVKGLVPVPVIGVPTSVGYGFGQPGEAALMAMLHSCSLGLTVVNIDNGIGAGASAALIAIGPGAAASVPTASRGSAPLPRSPSPRADR